MHVAVFQFHFVGSDLVPFERYANHCFLCIMLSPGARVSVMLTFDRVNLSIRASVASLY